jgi:hypothetical protein
VSERALNTLSHDPTYCAIGPACARTLPVIEFVEATIAIPANTQQQGIAVLGPTEPLNISLSLNLYSSVDSFESCDIAPGKRRITKCRGTKLAHSLTCGAWCQGSQRVSGS